MKFLMGQRNKKGKSFILSREGLLFLFVLFWLAVLIRGVIERWWELWNQFSYVLFHLFLLLFFTLLAWALGRKISKVLKVDYSDVIEEFPFATSLGLGCFSIVTLLLGGARLFYPRAVYLVTVLILILVIREIREIFWEIRELWKENHSFKPTFVQVLIFTLIGLTLLICLAGTFTLPLSYDALSYHLGVPKIYMKNQGIVYLPYNVYSNFPFNVEMLYAYSILLTGGEVLAKMIHFLLGVLTSFALYVTGRRYFDYRVGLLSAAIFINIPLVGELSTLCYNDLGLALFVSLAIFAFMNWYSSHDLPRKQYGISWLYASGIFTGLAMGTKYTGITFLFFFLIIAVAVGSMMSKGRRKRTVVKNLAVFVFIAVAVFSPWMIKNLLLSGNPLFPLLYPVFGGGDWTDSHYQRFVNVHLPNSYTVQGFFSQVWQLSVGRNFGLLFIFILPVTIFLRGVNRQIKFLLLYSGYFYFMWFFLTHHVDRFAIPMFTLLSLVVAYILTHIPRKGRIILGGVTGLFMVVNLFLLSIVATTYDFLGVFTGLKTKEEYLTERLYYYPAIKYINEELPSKVKVLFIGANQTYYCQRPLLSNSPLDKNIIVEVVKKSRDAEDIARRLRGMGVTHLYLNLSEVKRTQETYSSFYWNEEEQMKFSEFSKKYTKKLFNKNGCFVWAMKDGEENPNLGK
ncbi:MAG TPA: phospholipid carrier-dependent glycosyltransferase [Candidatus Omnitrophica bacterium]|nr:phospholipid carrier-dependent glycosyltransferase [Candidatus Omnitrophota bacterium]